MLCLEAATMSPSIFGRAEDGIAVIMHPSGAMFGSRYLQIWLGGWRLASPSDDAVRSYVMHYSLFSRTNEDTVKLIKYVIKYEISNTNKLYQLT